MGLRINNNISAFNAHRTLASTDNRLSGSIEKLSSGFKINRAGDDPAGLVISEKLRAQVSGLNMAISNANDAVNMVKTAEGALAEVHNLLRSMRDLAIHASNTGATDSASIAADQAQIQNAIESINKISETTQFGQKKLLDGSAGITASIKGDAVLAGDFSNPDITLETDDKVSVNVTTAAERGYVTMTGLTTGDASVGTAGSFTINGTTFDYAATENANSIVNNINSQSSQTGVTASLVSGTGIVLETKAYGADAEVTVSASVTTLVGAADKYDAGVDAEATVSVGGTAVSDTTWSAGDGLTLKDSRGNQIILTEEAGSTASDKGEQFAISAGTLTFQVGAYKDQTRSVNIGSVAASTLGLGIVSGENVSTLDVTTETGAQDAIAILDKAISDVSNTRASLGATQRNVLESSINSLTVAKENIQASESAIRDTDMAAEMVEFTKLQILQQAGVSMLAQANQGPQALLSLLR